MTTHCLTNPALLYFAEEQTPGALYRAAETMILWNETRHGIRDVTVVFMPARRVPVLHPLWRHWFQYSAQWNRNFGCTSQYWMNGASTPDGLFEYFRACGFAAECEISRACVEFARIEECAWARDRSHAPKKLPSSSSEQVASVLRQRDNRVRDFRAHRSRPNDLPVAKRLSMVSWLPQSTSAVSEEERGPIPRRRPTVTGSQAIKQVVDGLANREQPAQRVGLQSQIAGPSSLVTVVGRRDLTQLFIIGSVDRHMFSEANSLSR